jgi:nicotinate-nucleotide pyrophosphorylase (carboxylating)
LTALGIAEAVALARDAWPGRTIQVECDSLEQVDAALDAGADGILLDNMTPEQVAAAIEARAVRRPACFLEASGGIDLETIASYARTGVDRISSGAITNSAAVLDIGLDFDVR